MVVEAPAAVFGFLWRLRSFRHLSFAAGLHAFSTYGLSAWTPALASSIALANRSLATGVAAAAALAAGLRGLAVGVSAMILSSAPGRGIAGEDGKRTLRHKMRQCNLPKKVPVPNSAPSFDVSICPQEVNP